MFGARTLEGGSEERAKNSGAVLGRVLGYLRPYRLALGGVLALVVIQAAVQALGPALIGQAIDTNIIGADRSGLASTMLVLLAVYLIGFIAQSTQAYLMGRVGQNFVAALRAQIFDKVQALPLRFFDQNKAGDLMSRLVNDIQTINQLIGPGLTQVIGSLFSLVGIVIAMLLLSWQLALVSFLIIPVMVWATVFFAGQSRRAFRQTRQAIGLVSSELQEEIAGVRVAQAFNRTELNIQRFTEANASNRDANIRAVAVTSAFSPTIDVLSTLASAIVAGFGGWLAYNNQLPVGTVVAFFLYVQQFFRPIQLISNLYTQLQGALAGAERIFELVDQPIEQKDKPEAQPIPPIKGLVEFKQVDFSYNSQTEPVLKNLNLTAQPGQTVAIVGPTGAGKSTLVNLIPRFYDVTGGQLSIDGYDVREVRLASLRHQIGIVPQDTYLFSGTIADNIRYGRLEASEAEVKEAARLVRAHEFIEALPQGYQTRLGERGSGISQGQRQLLAFARAVLADHRLLILDEATASIDPRTEALIQTALKKLLSGRTAFVIAHRLSTVREADVILVLEQGQMIEQGNHEELLSLNGKYAELYRRQFQDEAA
jgi:ATP-binding cassette subfamily B protein/subfamily B ATP-binding cassette protein MsbA